MQCSFKIHCSEFVFEQIVEGESCKVCTVLLACAPCSKNKTTVVGFSLNESIPNASLEQIIQVKFLKKSLFIAHSKI